MVAKSFLSAKISRPLLIERSNSMKTITLNEAELEEVFSRSSGPGGQNVNKVSTRVTLRHLPTNISVTVQDSRSQGMNRQLARERLLAALQQRERQAAAAAQQQRERLRRQKAKRPHAVKQRILAEKHHRAIRKKDRRFRDE
jgi:protein subunit release factor B